MRKIGPKKLRGVVSAAKKELIQQALPLLIHPLFTYMYIIRIIIKQNGSCGLNRMEMGRDQKSVIQFVQPKPLQTAMTYICHLMPDIKIG